MIYFSTSSFKKLSTYKSAKHLSKYGIKNIEMSGGTYEKFNKEKFLKLSSGNNLIIHNYFPQPKKPFVFNLASKERNIIEKSMRLAKKAIKLSSSLSNKIYSFHAGFLFDPKINELGKTIKKIKLNNLYDGIEIFLENIKKLSKYADKYDVELLIENNVITKSNLTNFNTNPFLMTNIDSCYFIMNNTPKNVNLLLDIGHLKVSSQTENFSKRVFFKKLNKWIKGYHISDNDGYIDSNHKINKKNSMLNYIKKNQKLYVVEVNEINCKTIKNQLNIIKDVLK